jgi:tetratricopeptide (TPR) repeat protein
MSKRPRSRTALTDRKPRQAQRRPSTKTAASLSAVERPMNTTPASLPPLPGPPAEAVAIFEAAMQAMQEHSYREAADGFRSVLSRYPAERGLLDRARVYLGLCERELRRQPAAPNTMEEHLTAATAALNNGDEEGAERLARVVLDDDPRQDLALYLLAVIEARRGSTESALSYLERAVEISPEAGAQARFDGDFESLRETETFRRLTEPPANAAPANSYRRARRGRGER